MNSDNPSRGNIDFGRDYDLYRGLSESELGSLADIARLKICSEQQYLFTQHTPAERVFNLITGCALVERMSSTGHRQVLAFLFPGDFVGLSNTEFFEYGVKTLTEFTAHEFNQQKLLALADSAPQLKRNIKDISANVLAHALDQVYVLGQKKADERLCFLIVELLQRMPGATPENLLLPMTRQDIADYLGLTVETVSRSLAKLKRDGVISIPSRHVLRVENLAEVLHLADME
ncbi:Crp/Fnr family transcriptional regulator [Haliea sp. E17]|uniref:Crp/Fnr family transcriptional regulator n=1 Tax=Haliea sp. E17 TaxID=3401576 RepID=UPI003AAFE059